MISIIVPVYQVEPFLHRCVDSIRNQTIRDLEILLIDDGSTDRCAEYCDEYARRDGRIRVFHTDNKGLSAARNLGLREAKGNYIGFVDSDDWVEPDMFEMLQTALEDSDADVCTCGYCIETVPSTIAEFQEASYTGDDLLRALLDGGCGNSVWNKLYRREVFQDIVFPEGKTYEDIAIMHRLLSRAKKLRVISDAKYHYQIRRESITKTYTAVNLISYADAHLDRYYFFRNEKEKLFQEKQDRILASTVFAISRVWRWWYGCGSEEKEPYDGRIEELLLFTKENLPLFGFRSWHLSLRVSTLFIHSKSRLSFALLYAMNQMYRKLWLRKTV